MTEVFFGDAVHEADKLDQYYQQHGELIGPLHGVPVTLKDQFDVKGADATLGYVGRAFKPATRDAAIVEILKSLGAIILAKTNLPQSIMVGNTIFSVSPADLHSGARRRTHFGALQRILEILTLPLVVLQEEKE